MKKRNLSLVALILLVIFVVFSFMPVILISTCWEENWFGGYVEDFSFLGSFAELANTYSLTGYLVYICLIFAFNGIISLIWQFVGKNSKITDIFTFSPVVSAVSFILVSLLYMLPEESPNSYTPNGYWSTTPGWGYYIEITLILAVAVMSVLIATGRVKNTIVIPKQVMPTNVDIPDTLRKYKQLLEEGVISQEEFEAKKKQLLDL